MRRDKLFVFVIGAAILVVVGFGAAAVLLSIADPDHVDKQVTARIIGAFQAMFGSVIAFAVGYLVGHNGNGDKGEDDGG